MTILSVRNILITATIFLSTNQAKILRNNALMTKMVSNFHRENDLSDSDTEKAEPVLVRMQNVLCKNFPTIPCNIITEDRTLKKLIEKSIQQISSKKAFLDKTTPYPSYLTLFPINNEEPANTDHEQTKHPREKPKNRHKKQKEFAKVKEKSHEKVKKMKGKTKHTSVYGRKKLRKFYPHKVKYRDKGRNKDFEDQSGERLSMSVEAPDLTLPRKHQHFKYKLQPADSPVWRIDYMKHGEAGGEADVFALDAAPSVMVDNNHDGRKDTHQVLHPDVYIKNNFVRKNLDSDGVD